jgi:hypothetical protein
MFKQWYYKEKQMTKTVNQRWEDGDDHDKRSEELYDFIEKKDHKECHDSFCFQSGGDGDNGETLMFILDDWFELQDKAKKVQEELITNVVQDVLDDELGWASYDCSRVWSAWGVGTMDDQDFTPVSERTQSITARIVDAVLKTQKETDEQN